MEPIQIAAAVVAVLTPFLIEGGKAAAKKAGEALWNAIETRVRGNAPAETALVDLKADPADEDNQAALRKELRKLIEADEAFRGEVLRLLEAAQAEHRTTLVGDGAIAQGPGAVAAGAEADALGSNGRPVLFSMYLRNAGGPAPVAVTLELPWGLHYWRGDFALEGDSARRLVWRGTPEAEIRLSAVLWPEPGADRQPRPLALALDGAPVLDLELRPDAPALAGFGEE